MDFWVYIVKCADDSYYTGHTDNLEQRIAQHQQRYFPSCYTATRLPVSLVYRQPCPTRIEALSAEQQIKGWSRKKKEAMMRGDWLEVSRLAKSKNTNTEQTENLSTADLESVQKTTTVRPELEPRACRIVESIEGHSITNSPNTVRPELVEGHSLTDNPSISSGRTVNATDTSSKKSAA